MKKATQEGGKLMGEGVEQAEWAGSKAATNGASDLSQVDQELGRLFGAGGRLDKAVEALSARLELVLRPSEPTNPRPDVAGEPRYLVPLAGRIGQEADRVEFAATRLADMFERLEV